MGFELLVNGVGNAFSVEHWGTNFVLRDDEFCLAVDCPDSYRRALHENKFEHRGGTLDVEALDAMFVTHLHGDHVNGLEMVLAYRRYVTNEPLDLYATPPVANALWNRRLGVALGQSWDGTSYQSLSEEDFYHLHQIPWEEAGQIGPFELTVRQTIHHIPTAALRISDGTCTLGYSCDTAFDETLVDWLEDCELVLHETSYGPGHTPIDALEDLPADLRRKMLLVHLPDDIANRESEFDLTFAEEGTIYDVQ